MAKLGKTITLDENVWRKVIEQARSENRNESNFIETVLIKYFQELNEQKQKTQAD